MTTPVQIIERDGEPEYAVVPIDQYRRLLALAENARDIAAADAALAELARGEDEVIPGRVADRLFDGESPLRVWREHRALTRGSLASQAGVDEDRIARIEAGQEDLRDAETLQRLATALRVDPDDLTPVD